MARKRGVTEIDVSGGFVDERGRRVNTDIPAEERGRVSRGKSNARKRLKQKQREADKRQREIQEEDEAKKPGAKKHRKKKSKEPDYTLDPEKEKRAKRKKKADAQKEKEKNEEKPKKKKRKKKTVGDYIKEGKPDKARKKMEKLQSKALAVLEPQEMEEVSEAQEAILMPSSAASSEVEFMREYDHIYGTLGSIIRKLEERMTDAKSDISSKDVYALMTMYSQMRETIADIRSIKDMNEQAEDLAQQVFDPAAKSAGESLVNVYYKTTSIIRQNVDDPKVVEELLEKLKIEISDQAGRLQSQFETARGRIVEVLNGGR